MNGPSSLVPIMPLMIAAILSLIFHRMGETPSALEGVAVGSITFALFAIWIWRVYKGARRQLARSRPDEMDG
ncbi:hypothetical protein EWH08_00245 [Sphingobium indicum]|uniref:Uncharacterized protein n=2 Tax=Sphingobium indicum TaxID=332055 RepID=A0A4Q4JA25_9SPHN|nr:hypothetical protein [Sphingobium indicum]NYI22296.1 hypothetical protein [Sphingobium indicum]RYM02988.1 hypothetical protein EWH08_00245 [Sphingobium indicum]